MPSFQSVLARALRSPSAAAQMRGTPIMMRQAREAMRSRRIRSLGPGPLHAVLGLEVEGPVLAWRARRAATAVTAELDHLAVLVARERQRVLTRAIPGLLDPNSELRALGAFERG